jgi:hypothetical protein
MAKNKSTTASSTDTDSFKTLVPNNKCRALSSTDTDSLRTLVPSTTTASSATASALSPTEKKAKTSWRDKSSFSSKPKEPGRQTWRDASLSEKELWEQCQKAKDKEQRNGYVLVLVGAARMLIGSISGATGVSTFPSRAIRFFFQALSF